MLVLQKGLIYPRLLEVCQSTYCSTPTEAHLTAVKRILRNLKGNLDVTLMYKKSESGQLIRYAGDQDNRLSTTGTTQLQKKLFCQDQLYEIRSILCI